MSELLDRHGRPAVERHPFGRLAVPENARVNFTDAVRPEDARRDGTCDEWARQRAEPRAEQ